MPALNVVIVGGGNSSHCLAGLASNAGHSVTILTRRPEKWNQQVTCENQDEGWLNQETEKEITGTVNKITKDAAECIPEADVVVLGGIPVHHYRSVLQQVCPHISKPGVLLGSLCAYGGFSWLCQEALSESSAATTCVFGTQSIPWTCGTLEYGSRGVVFGAKRHLHIAFDNEECVAGNSKYEGQDGLKIVGDLLRNPIVERTDFLTCTLWPNNPLFHPTVLYGLFSDWDMETPYKVEDVPARIYADVTQRSADYIQKMDDEMQKIVAAVKVLYPEWDKQNNCRPLRDCLVFHYADLIGDPTNIFTILRTNKGYAKHHITYKKVGEGLIVPDVTHKFFTTDLPFGLVIYKDIANELNVDVPVIDELIKWNQKMVSKEFMLDDGTLNGKDVSEGVLPSKYGGIAAAVAAALSKSGDKK
jgi:hypothetical protein